VEAESEDDLEEEFYDDMDEEWKEAMRQSLLEHQRQEEVWKAAKHDQEMDILVDGKDASYPVNILQLSCR
jgi:hypothetical protein